MRSSKWRLKPWEFLVLVAAVVYVGLTVLAIDSTRVYDGEGSRAALLCKALSNAAEAYIDHPANPEHRLPSSVSDLIHPPWGGPSLYRDATEEPRDPWGNAFQMEHRRTPDGTDYLLIWTAKPDGTKISQFGIGKLAEPKR